MGAHFYCMTIGPFSRSMGSPGQTVSLCVKRGGGGWVVGRASSQILGDSLPWKPTIAAQLLENGG
jgi:hypothetical protein